MKIQSKARRLTTLFVTGIVLALTTAVVGKATQVISTPNASFISYSLGAGASTGFITPVANQAVLLMGTQTTVGYRGVASATLLHVPASFIEWVGLESTAGAGITQGFSGTAGTHILFLDFSHQVDVRVASADSILIRNGSSGVRTGNITLIW
jgi:hypothetical protein